MTARLLPRSFGCWLNPAPDFPWEHPSPGATDGVGLLLPAGDARFAIGAEGHHVPAG